MPRANVQHVHILFMYTAMIHCSMARKWFHQHSSHDHFNSARFISLAAPSTFSSPPTTACPAVIRIKRDNKVVMVTCTISQLVGSARKVAFDPRRWDCMRGGVSEQD